MRVVLLSLILTTSGGCALLYDFEDGAGGTTGNASSAATRGNPASAALATADASASTGSGSDPCIVRGDIDRFDDPLVTFDNGSLAGRPGGVLAFGSRSGQAPEILAVSAALELSPATTQLGGYSRAAAFGDHGVFMSGPPSPTVQSCVIAGDTISCGTVNLLGPQGDIQDVGWGGTAGENEWLLTMHLSLDEVIVYRTLTSTGGTAPIVTFDSNQVGAPTGMSIYDSNGNGPDAGDAFFARHGESVLRCQLDGDACVPGTIIPNAISGLRDAVQRQADIGRDMYFIDGAGGVHISNAGGEQAPFLEGVDAHLLASTRGHVFVVARVGSFSRILACGDGQSASLASCQCVILPGPAEQVLRIAAAPDGTNVYFTTKEGQLYRWATDPP